MDLQARMIAEKIDDEGDFNGNKKTGARSCRMNPMRSKFARHVVENPEGSCERKTNGRK